VDTESLVDVRYEVPWERWKSRKGSPLAWREQLSHYARLRVERFDWGLDLQGHSKTALCLRIARPKRRIAVEGRDPFARSLNPLARIPDSAIHTVERNLAALANLADLDADASPIMPTLALERRAVTGAVGIRERLATISIGAGHPTKAYPIELWEEVVAELASAGFQVAMLGGPEVSSPKGTTALNLIGKTSLAETMAWVAESALHLCADTGTGHIAAAYGAPVVSVFGPTDPARYRPSTEFGVVLRKGNEPGNVAPLEIVEAALKIGRENGAALPH
jgi:ADP-heptose:LPS heptosyltransferase